MVTCTIVIIYLIDILDYIYVCGTNVVICLDDIWEFI